MRLGICFLFSRRWGSKWLRFVVRGSGCLLLWGASVAQAENCYLINECSHYRRDSSASPSRSTQLKINPSAVPTEKGWGVEGIYYDTEVDLALVRGNGRMGAALSPSASEETFFGAPGFEREDDYFIRKEERKKFPNDKITLATALEVINKKGSGHRRFSLRLGAMAKYNKLSQNLTGGAGVNVVWGPLTAGYSIYEDQTQLRSDIPAGDPFLVKYGVQTYNVGLYLNSLILNYSNLRLQNEEKTYTARVDLYTASLSAGKFIFTGAYRREDSPRPEYNYEKKILEYKQFKEEYFGGLQYSATKNILVGGLYNYYLLREAAVTATIFF